MHTLTSSNVAFMLVTLTPSLKDYEYYEPMLSLSVQFDELTNQTLFYYNCITMTIFISLLIAEPVKGGGWVEWTSGDSKKIKAK